jgi:hypothetical protein
MFVHFGGGSAVCVDDYCGLGGFRQGLVCGGGVFACRELNGTRGGRWEAVSTISDSAIGRTWSLERGKAAVRATLKLLGRRERRLLMWGIAILLMAVLLRCRIADFRRLFTKDIRSRAEARAFATVFRLPPLP